MAELTSIDDLKPASYNPRSISDKAATGLAKSMDAYGDLSGVVFNVRTGNLVCGHQRVDQLRKAGSVLMRDPTNNEVYIMSGTARFPVRQVDWPESMERAANVTANNPHIGGEFTDTLADLLGEIKLSIGDDDFAELQLDALLKEFPAPQPEVSEDEVPEPPAEPVTKLGDLWQLGDHRILCGSCEEFGRIAEPKSARLMVTDPPYGVSYAGKNEFLNAYGKGNNNQTPIENDHHKPAEMSTLWKQWFLAVRPVLGDGAAYYVTGPQGGDLLLLLLEALRDSGYPLRHMLIWAKNNHVLGRCDYHYKHEPIIYGRTEGSHKQVMNRSETSLWEIDKPQKSDLHPTMKPVALYARAIGNSSDIGDLVAEPFSGSGTAIVACEQMNRRCVATELSPAYVDVAIERWQNLTGGEAKKI